MLFLWQHMERHITTWPSTLAHHLKIHLSLVHRSRNHHTTYPISQVQKPLHQRKTPHQPSLIPPNRSQHSNNISSSGTLTTTASSGLMTSTTVSGKSVLTFPFRSPPYSSPYSFPIPLLLATPSCPTLSSGSIWPPSIRPNTDPTTESTT